MWISVGLESLISMLACWQLLRLFALPGLSARWRCWGVLALLLVLGLQALYLHARRGGWTRSDPEATLTALLQLAMRRAQAGIRLGWLNIGGCLVLILFTALLAWPDLQPSHWRHDPHLRRVIGFNLAINGPLLALTIGICACYIRRQRRRLAWLRASWREQIGDADSCG